MNVHPSEFIFEVIHSDGRVARAGEVIDYDNLTSVSWKTTATGANYDIKVDIPGGYIEVYKDERDMISKVTGVLVDNNEYKLRFVKRTSTGSAGSTSSVLILGIEKLDRSEGMYMFVCPPIARKHIIDKGDYVKAIQITFKGSIQLYPDFNQLNDLDSFLRRPVEDF